VNQAIKALQLKVERLENEKKSLEQSLRCSEQKPEAALHNAARVMSESACAENNSLRDQV